MAAFSLQANAVSLPRALEDETSHVQVQLDVEKSETGHGKAPVCEKSMLSDSCSGYRYRVALELFREEMKRYEELLKVLEVQNPEVDYVDRVAPRISMLLQDIAIARAGLEESLERLPKNERVAFVPQAFVNPQVASKSVGAGVVYGKLRNSTIGSARNTSAAGTLPQKELTHMNRIWLALVFVLFVVVLIAFMMCVVSLLRIQDDDEANFTQGAGAQALESQQAKKKADSKKADSKPPASDGEPPEITQAPQGVAGSTPPASDADPSKAEPSKFTQAKSKADSKPPAPEVEPSKFIQVVLPYWLPTEPSSRGLLWLGVFGVIFAMDFALALWGCSFFVLIGHFTYPSLIKHTSISFLGNWGLRAASIVVLCLGSAILFLLRKKLEGRWRQWFLLSIHFFLMLIVNMWGVASSYIARAHQDALYVKDRDTFWTCIRLLFAASSVVMWIGIAQSYVSAYLLFEWRVYLTESLSNEYMASRRYYALESTYRVVDNPDERLQADISGVSSLTFSLFTSIVGSIMNMMSYSMVLWQLMPMLTFTCFGYASFGSIVTLLFTWQIAKFNYMITKAEADFRFQLTHVRTNAEAIAFYRGEEREKGCAFDRLQTCMSLLYRQLHWNAASDAFTSYLGMSSYIVPIIVLSPQYLDGVLSFGAFGQANQAFFATLGSLSFIIADKGTIAGLATMVNRVGILQEAIRHKPDAANITYFPEETSSVNIKDLTAMVPGTSQTIVRSLSLSAGKAGSVGSETIVRSLSLSAGKAGSVGSEAQVRILLSGPSGVGKSSLLRIIAGLWTEGEGEVTRPRDVECMFLPQRPYMPQGDLRTQLLYPIVCSPDGSDAPFSDDELRRELKHVGLEDLPDRFQGGFNTTCDWARVLSLGEQQRVAAVRCFVRQPKLTVLDEATSALSIADENRLYEHFKKLNHAYISVGHRPSLVAYHDNVLELKGDGEWKYLKAKDFRM